MVVRSPECLRSAHYPREDPELLPAERKDAAGMPRHRGLPAPRTSKPQVPPGRYCQSRLPLMRAQPASRCQGVLGRSLPSLVPEGPQAAICPPGDMTSLGRPLPPWTPAGWREVSILPGVPGAWRSRRCPLETSGPTQCPLRSCPLSPGESLKPPTLSRAKDQPQLGGRRRHCQSPRLPRHYLGEPTHRLRPKTVKNKRKKNKRGSQLGIRCDCY